MTTKEALAYVSGQWDAWNRVLNMLNELEEQTVAKKIIYRRVSDMRPNLNYPKD